MKILRRDPQWSIAETEAEAKVKALEEVSKTNN